MFSLVNTPMFEQEAPKWSYEDEPIRQDTHVWTAHQGSRSSSATFNFLQEINSSWIGILNRILRASKLYGIHLSLEPDFKPEPSFTAGNFLTAFQLKLARDYFLLNRKFLNRIWELQCFMGDIFPLNRILNRNLHFSRKFSDGLSARTCERLIPLEPKILKPDLRASLRLTSLEPDFKPEFFILNRKFSDGL